MPGKPFKAADMLGELRGGQDRAGTGTRDRGTVTQRDAKGSASPAPLPQAGRYERSTYYVTPAQRAWTRRVAREAAPEDGSISASDVVRLALDIVAALDPADLRRRLVDRAWEEAEGAFPFRANRGLPRRQGD
jgi:hypothetical protein